ncbi:hypothetical protein NE237_025189 [Protea cynaroides]|uniref:Uncharacterized protein n=1 Tax=Protea cynaroides TaxID=273540 RepID=A0A9Q0H1X7_9MAGN|nr:hypothetical protein NE237_025189 [Protea cynaroides]
MPAGGSGAPAAGLERETSLVGTDEGLERIMFPENISELGFLASTIFSRPASMATAETRIGSQGLLQTGSVNGVPLQRRVKFSQGHGVYANEGDGNQFGRRKRRWTWREKGHTSDKCHFRSGIDDDVQVEEAIINQKEGVPEEGLISREGATNGTSADNTKSNGATEDV